MKEQVQKITHVEHILKRPDSYVGEIEQVKENYWILNEEKTHFVQKPLTYSQALLKIFDEILVNAIDRNSIHPEEVNKISVLIDKESGIISVENNGPLGGISVEKHPTEKLWNPELTFGHLLTSTNYNDEEGRVVGGRNGYGAKLANIYSKLFVVTIQDDVNKVKYTQKWENNMTTCHKASVTKYSKSGSSINILFQPDWQRFGMTCLNDDFFNIIEKRVYDAMICTGDKCKVYFMGSIIRQKSLEAYAKMYMDESAKVATFKCPRWDIVVTVSDNNFQQMSYVNGICTTKGGSHVDYVTSQISQGIIQELGKKTNNLKPQNVKNCLFVFVKSTLVNPSFSSQAKSECTLKPANFGSAFTPTSQFIKSILKTGVQDEVLALSKFKEQKELRKTDGTRKSRIQGIPKLDDANLAGTTRSEKCTLIITEGDSAKALAISGLAVVGRDYYGVFPLRGKCKNVRDASVAQLLANQEFSDLKKIIGLQQEKEYKSLNDLRYGRLMIMTDADHDGSHIKGLVLNMFHYFWPSLLEMGFVVSMVTPIIKASKGPKTLSFFTESRFRDWYQTNQLGWKIKYYKGLGTSTSAEAQEYFKKIQNLTVKFNSDENTEQSIVLAFDKKNADNRKKWLLDSTGKTPSELEVNYGDIESLDITDFIHKDLINFSLADLRRSIAHMCDGLKPSQRKVIYACFQKNLKDEMKVAQLAAYVSEKTSYHHGEVSLADTIVKLAQDYMGSNNINLLEPCGQFGTRLLGGKDASQTRYIFTKLTETARKLFDSRDDPVLTYLDDDGKKIEPEFFVPVLPTILINGSEGIGTGFSCQIPPYNPDDIRDNIFNILNKQPIKNMSPWYRGFKGTIAATNEERTSWLMTGCYTQRTDGTIIVTELPPGRWTQDYKEYLETLLEKKKITNFKNNSTTDEVYFEIQGYSGKSIETDLKITKTLSTNNMHLFHPTKGIWKYASAEDILVDFTAIRIEYYNKRKKALILALMEKETLLRNKARFVKLVTEEELIIFKRKKVDIEKDLTKLEFGEGPFDYLLDIKTYQYTEEAMKQLNDTAEQTSKQLIELKGINVLDMWKNDICN